MRAVAPLLAALLTSAGAVAQASPDQSYGQTREAVMSIIEDAAREGRSISGQQVNEYEVFIECTSMERIHELTGRWPAMLGLELMFIIENPAYREFFMKRAREHAARGGLVTITWHARNPTEICPRGEYYKCSQHKMSDERLARLLDAQTPEHALWARDVDAIADVLKEMTRAGIAPIFRPYHEMNGDWFWWGRKAQYAALYRALHERLTKMHGLEDLVWAWSPDKTSEDAERYFPGAAFVDALGADIYTSDREGDMYEVAKSNVAPLRPDAPFAFTEIGLLPGPEIFQRTAPAWFLLWGGEFIDKRWTSDECALCNEAAHVAEIYALESVVTLDELDWPEQSGVRFDDEARAAPPGKACPARLID